MPLSRGTILKIASSRDERKVVVTGPNDEGKYGGAILVGSGDLNITSTEDRHPWKSESEAREYLQQVIDQCDKEAPRILDEVGEFLSEEERRVIRSIADAASSG